MTALKKILYVEDEADIREITQLALELIGGYHILICSTGQEAIAKAGDFAPDLILLNVMMPNMDGPTTLANLREIPNLADTAVIFMTATVQPGEIKVLLNHGALDVIAKPFDPMTLATKIQHIWERRFV